MPIELVDGLETELHSESARLAADVDAFFVDLLASPGDGRDTLYEAMRHAAIGGGKRLRPLLTIAGARLFAVDPERALRAGCAIEAIHVYSLIHDDLPCMDDDDMRRGKPTVHKAFGEHRLGLAKRLVHGRLAAAHVVIVHARQIVVDQRIDVDRLDRAAGAKRAFRIDRE